MDTDRAMADRAWRGYSRAALLPAVLLATAASAVVLTGRWYLSGLSELAGRFGALTVFALAAAVWPGLLAVLVYRTTTYTYRLTDRAVLVDRGFRHRPEPPVWLQEIAEVTAGAGPFGRLTGVGWVAIRTAGGRVVRLTGVRDPSGFASAIRDASRGMTKAE
jgi:membrane protein YdbS with pleckstrin-like domain